MKGLVVDEPWITLILKGQKTWEMRSSTIGIRGRIALIRKGTGHIVGVADLVDVIGPLDAIARRAHRDKHCIPKIQDEYSARWNFAWVLENAAPLIAPVAYRHPPGAVIWVNLDDSVTARLRPATGAAGSAPKLRLKSNDSIPVDTPKVTAPTTPRFEYSNELGESAGLLPFAKDGTRFGSHLARAGKYTIGAKGEEEQHTTFAQALASLKKMPRARWRRPNSQGNWGIVTAVRWARIQREESDI